MSNRYRTSRTEQIAPRVPHAIMAALRLYASQRDISVSRAAIELLWIALRSHGLLQDVKAP